MAQAGKYLPGLFSAILDAQEALLTLFPAIPTTRDAARVQPLLDRAIIGELLSRAEAQALIEADEAELPALCAAAVAFCVRMALGGRGTVGIRYRISLRA